MTASLENLYASMFIARPDVKAEQHSNGSYSPTRTYPDPSNREVFTNVGWKRSDILAHIAGERTFGHYLLNTDDQVKLFCFDVDLRGLDRNQQPEGWLPTSGLGDGEVAADFVRADPRTVWKDRANPQRNYLKYSMRLCAHMLAEKISSALEIHTAVAYSGNKGFHVYGFTGPVSAADARDGAMIVLDDLDMFELERGDSLFKLSDEKYEPENPFVNFSIEVYPKQNSLAGKDLGNLLRLPLGKNTKSKDPTFFMDLTSPLTVMQPVDPVWALTTSNPWKRSGE